jgi:hypothetical protein
VTTCPTPCAPLQDGDTPVTSEQEKKRTRNNRYKNNKTNAMKNSMCDIKIKRQLNMVPIPKLETFYSSPPVEGYCPNQVSGGALKTPDLEQI